MAVSTSNGSLGFVSTLDNSDFQAKSLQDIKLIQLRLQLTGDTSGIEKYNEAIKAALQTEINLRTELDQILADAKVKTQDYISTVQSEGSTGTIFSDSAAEVQAYEDALIGLQDGAAIVAQLNEQLDALVIKQDALTASFEAGTISQVEYDDAMEDIVVEQQRLVQNIQQINDFFSESILLQNQNAEATVKNTEAIVEEIGVLAELKATLAELKSEQLGASASELPLINQQIQETEVNISKFQSVGKVAFTDVGTAVEQAEPKVGKLASTISRVTDIQNLASRVVTQFTRQIVSLGVGFLSLEIGAKAIESLITYIQNLDYFTGRLDQAKQNMDALNATMAEADTAAGKQIGALETLYNAATDVNNSMADRLSAAEQLRESDAATFQNATNLAIVNGQLKKSYEDLTVSILENAKSQAALSQIEKLAGDELNNQFEIDKNNAEKGQQIAKAYADYKAQLAQASSPEEQAAIASGASTYKGSGGTYATPLGTLDEQVRQINEQTNAKNLIPTQNNAILQGQISFLEGYVKNVSKSVTALQAANQLLGDSLQNFNNLIAGANNKTLLDNIKNALQTKLDSLAPNDAQMADIKAKLQQVDDLEKQYQVKATSKTNPAVSAGQTQLAAQTKVLQSIDALKDKYAAKETDRDNQQEQAIQAAFTLQVNNINALNKKYDDYVAKYGAAAAKAAGLQRIDPTQLTSTKDNALGSLAGTQEVTDTENQINQQKVLFQAYEDFKLKAGTDAANKLYGNELGGYSSFIDYLKSLQPSEEDLTSSDPFVQAYSNGVNDLLKTEIPKAQDAALKLQQAHLQQLIIQDQSYQQQRATLITVANENIQQLNAEGFTQQATQEQQNLDDQLTALDEANFKKIQAYKDVFDGIQNLTNQQAQSDLTMLQRQADSDLLNETITIEAYEAVTKQLGTASLALKNSGTPQTLQEIGQAFTTLGGDLANVNANLGSMVTAAGSAFTAIGKIKDLQNDIASSTTSQSDKTKDEISEYVEAGEEVVSIISNITSAAKARQAAEEAYYNSVIAFQTQYNVALDEQIRLQYQTAQGSIFYTDTAKELSDAVEAYDAATNQYTASLAALQQGQAIVGTKSVADANSIVKDAAAGAVVGSIGGPVGAAIGAVVGGIAGLFGGKKQVNVLEPLLQAYPQLIEASGKFNASLAQSLIANNQVTDATKTALQSTLDYYNEEQAALDQITSTLQSLVGDLGTSISNSLVQAFEDGTDAATAFGQAVSQILSSIIQQDLFVAIFGQQLSALQTKLTADVLANDGNTQAEIIEDITNFYKTAQGLVPDYLAGLQAAQTAGTAVGLTLFPSSSTTGASASLSGGIQSNITEDTADILAGTMKGIQLNTLNTNNLLQNQSLSLGQLLMIAQDHLNVAIQIQVNTLKIAVNSDAMIASLTNIDKNTADTSGDLLRAAGKFGF